MIVLTEFHLIPTGSFLSILNKRRERGRNGKTEISNLPLPVFIYHDIFLTINKVRWSYCFGKDKSFRAFFPVYVLNTFIKNPSIFRKVWRANLPAIILYLTLITNHIIIFV